MKNVLVVSLFLVCLVTTVEAVAAPASVVAEWRFEKDGVDGTGRGNDVYLPGDGSRLAPAHAGAGLRCTGVPVLASDSPDLRLAPGLEIECWVKVDRLGASWEPILIKDREYQLRIDPPGEGSEFSFFAHLGGWEPRVASGVVPQLGKWHHVRAGWDGDVVWINVDGKDVRKAREAEEGLPLSTSQPVKLGFFKGTLDEVRITNPGARDDSVARWFFETDLSDASGRGHDLAGEAIFETRDGHRALRTGADGVAVDDHPDLQLAPGFRLDCAVYVDEVTDDSQVIAIKNEEYQLRINPAGENGAIAFFVCLDGVWEPRVQAKERVEPGKWYFVMARWDGEELVLEVNGKRTTSGHRGIAAPTSNALRVGDPGLLIDRLRVTNPRQPLVRLRSVSYRQALLRIGRPEPISVTVMNVGLPADDCSIALELPESIQCVGELERDLGNMQTGETKTIGWTVRSDVATRGTATFRVAYGDTPPTLSRQTLVFSSADGIPDVPLPPANRDASSGATTFYVDARSGNNASAGTSPEAAWKDFTPINGKTLGPGERLLIRRGSILNQELVVSAAGTAENWAEIGAYGEGARPMIRRNWDIADRCASISNPDYLRIRGLVFCYAAKGLVVHYSRGGHRGLLIEDCIAHHIEGLYRPNAHGIPEWTYRGGDNGKGAGTSAGIAVLGSARGVTMRDCEMYQCSWGYFFQGTDVILDRIYCHHCTVRNTSPHPALVSVYRCLMENCVLDASGWHASAGTMGIMLVNPQGLTIRNCTFRNMPDVGNHDMGGIDFEANGNGCVVEHCTFENNAGAAIEVLGLRSPQPTNVEIRNSRFIKNNSAVKLGPSEIYIWGKSPDPKVCCSNGWIRNNGYVLLPKIKFFVNEAPTMTSWSLEGNREYASVEELDRAMPFNRPPVVNAGDDIHTDKRSVRLAGVVADDGLPAKSRLAVRWEVLEGPGQVAFAPATAANTSAIFSEPGDYLLRLVGDDGELWLCDTVAVHVLDPGTTMVKGWEFNGWLDKENWSEADLGTKLKHWKNASWPTKAHPVKYVSGGHYMVVFENSPKARLLSPDNLKLRIGAGEKVVLKLHNPTPAKQLSLKFTTEARPDWSRAGSVAFPVVPADNTTRTYVVDMAAVDGWEGSLKQLGLQLGSDAVSTGTIRLDYLWIVR